MNGWVMVDGDWVHRPWWKRAINIPLRVVPLKGCVAGSNPAAGILPTDPDGSTVTE